MYKKNDNNNKILLNENEMKIFYFDICDLSLCFLLLYNPIPLKAVFFFFFIMIKEYKFCSNANCEVEL